MSTLLKSNTIVINYNSFTIIFSGNSILSSPAIGSDGTIYFGSLDGNLYAVDPAGALKWNYQAGNI